MICKIKFLHCWGLGQLVVLICYGGITFLFNTVKAIATVMISSKRQLWEELHLEEERLVAHLFPPIFFKYF